MIEFWWGQTALLWRPIGPAGIELKCSAFGGQCPPSLNLSLMYSEDEAPGFDLIGVGAPIMDIVASVPDSFLYNVRGEKGGMVMIDADEMAQLVAKLPEPPEMTPGGSAANTIFNAARLGLRTTFIGKLGGDELARLYRARFGSSG